MNQKPTVLLVEDDLILVEVLQDKLSSSGFKVLIAKNGLKGLKKAMTEEVDLILLDLIMPRMEGMTMLRHLREDEHLDTPVIVLTNLGSDEDAKGAMDLGAKDFLIKADHGLDDVVDRIKKILK
ncbi:MAG: hypothetical protein A2079_07340 [Geobacteraceae bacterium GWC2_48_7]|nr:MAG: two component transcriptional regulator [Parcubacteria group bacterium GW2011_GWA2_40_23]OGT98563.1 MAG: hypothetical protein A2079_07340 [Geobacteraceae bacterium GWC2_48_7]